MLFLTSKDYDILNRKISDLWEELQETKRRVRELEDENEECTPISELRASDMVMVKHPKKGWVKGCVMEKCLCAAFVVVGEGECVWTDKVRKIEE